MVHKNKKVIHFSASDNEGAASAAYRFHKNLQKYGVESIFFVKKKTVDDASVIQIPKQNIVSDVLARISNKLENLLGRFDARYYVFDRGRYSLRDMAALDDFLPFEPDAVVIHWISGFLELDVLIEIKTRFNQVKFYWYLMDMAPMTGACHYAWNCKGYTLDCSNCPAVKWPYNNFPKSNLLKKIKIVNNVSLDVLSASSHLKRQIQNSSLFGKRNVYDVMLGVDPDVFKPNDKAAIRKKNGFEEDKKMMFFRATNDQRKGMHVLLEALEEMALNDAGLISKLAILTAGDESANEAIQKIGFKHYNLGKITTQRHLAEAYQMADFMVVPSLEDSGPMMINESILSGTPVVSFRMGVAEDLIIDGETGYIANCGDVDALKEKITNILYADNAHCDQMSKKCRELGVLKSSYEAQAKQFFDVLVYGRNK